MIDAGIESTTIAFGPKHTTLCVKYALAGRVFAQRFGGKLDFDGLKLLGFQKVVLTDGFSSTDFS